MKLRLGVAFLALAAILATSSALQAQQQDPYRDGPVVNVSFVRTAPGQFDAYMRYIFGDYARLMEAYKAAGIILDWGVLTTQTRHPDEGNVVLTTTYPNMAAFDGLDERMSPISRQVLSMSDEQMSQAGVQRGQMRTVIGSQLYRVLVPR